MSLKRPAYNSWGVHARFSLIRNFRASSSCLVMPCRAIAVARYKAGTCFILLPRATLRRSSCTSGSAPTFKNTSYALRVERVFSIRPSSNFVRARRAYPRLLRYDRGIHPTSIIQQGGVRHVWSKQVLSNRRVVAAKDLSSGRSAPSPARALERRGTFVKSLVGGG